MSTSAVTAQLEAMAGTDPLTGVPNRRAFLQQCQTVIASCKRHGTVCSILMVDLDHFKQINDRYGHAFGDTALCKVTERIAAAIRSMDTAARWGGEEFWVPDEGRTALSLTVSIGIAVYEAAGNDVQDDVQDMVQRADQRLYEAKRTGRNCVL
jgi:GGDEF domain-containing protein